MPRQRWAVALLGALIPVLGAPAIRADESDLTHGVFICHHAPAMDCSNPPEDWCQHYLDEHRIESCEEQNPSIMTAEERVWFVLSAFPEPKQWCGTEFGFGAYSADLFRFTGWGPCTPGESLELSSDGWPGPLQGTAVVSTGVPWQGNFEPVYYFSGYAYQGEPGQIPIDVDPETGFVGWGNCLIPADTFGPICLPAMGILTDGTACCPGWLLHVCCVAAECFVYTEEECLATGGRWHPDWPTDCGPPDPCPLDELVCCVEEECFILNEGECAAFGGEWHYEWESCSPNPCARPHPCCIGESCYFTTEDRCADLEGEWHPDWDSCHPNPCAYPRHVCCVGETCYIFTEQQCADAGGNWHEEWDSCQGNPCASPQHACCVGEVCYILPEQECTDAQGEWHAEWDSCYPNPCEYPRAVCCVDYDCHITTEDECADMVGVWYPEWDTCDPNPCPLLPEDDLSYGVFVCHHSPEIVYSLPPEGWCQHYTQGFRIESCDEQNPCIMSDEPRVWFVLAAFLGDRRWCGVEFGFGDYDRELFAFACWGPCATGTTLELPTSGWPGPLEGTAVVTTGLPWFGNFEPVYYFTGYAYAGGSGQIPLAVDPPTGFVGWANCLIPAMVFESACLPALGIWTDGVPCCPAGPTYACCVGTECFVRTEEDCLEMGGAPLPSYEDCGPPDPCSLGACCVGNDCFLVTEEECQAIYGEWHSEWSDCDPNPCPIIPVLLVTEVTLRQEGRSAVLAWRAAPDPRVRAFLIRRGTAGDDIGQMLAEVAPSGESRQAYRDQTVTAGETYRYWIDADLLSGTTESFGPWQITVTGSGLPRLIGAGPNPVLEEASIAVYMPARREIILEIYAPTGRLVRSLGIEAGGPGIHRFRWDRRDQTGAHVASGAYFFLVRVGLIALPGRLIVVQ